jgi:hypothetical protein
MTFRNSKIVYYGPHPCQNCIVLICKMGNGFGDTAFTYPKGPIYPNTEWHPHVCDPQDVYAARAREARARVLAEFPGSAVFLVGRLGYVVCEDRALGPEGPIISCNCSYGKDIADAWMSADDRSKRQLPKWNAIEKEYRYFSIYLGDVEGACLGS